MLKIIEQATIAAEQENWSDVNRCLQQLPLPLEETDLPKVINLALTVLKAADFQQQWEVAKLLPKLGQGAIVPLIEILKDEEADLEVRWFSGRILGEFDHPIVIITLVQLLQTSEDEDLLEMAAQALANIGTSAVESLSDLLADEQSRLLAVRALAYIRRPETIEPLLRVVDDPDPEIRAIAIEALSSFHNNRIPPILIKALKDTATTVRKEAVTGLGFRADQLETLDLVAEIKPLLYDLNGQVCQQAAIALGRLGTDQAGDALFRVLKSAATPVWLKIEIVRVLGWTKTPLALEYLQEGLRWSPPEVCLEITTVLGRVSSLELKSLATEILIEFLNSEQNAAQQPPMKQALAQSLGELGQTIAIDSLLFLAADAERTVSLHAIAALKKFRDLEQKLQQCLADDTLSPTLKQGAAIALAEFSVK